MALSRCLASLMTVVGLGLASPMILAQTASKIGFVNTERILRDAVPAKAAQSKLETEFSRRDRELQEMGTRLKQLGERLERDAMVMSESERGRRQREVADLDKDYQRRQREFREDLNQRRNEELSQVVERANRVLTRDFLLDAISRDGDSPGDRVIDVMISRLRKKLGDDPRRPMLIQTVTGRGYRLSV